MKYETKFLIGIGISFAVMFLVNAVLIISAIKSDDGIVEENYYSRGLNYQQEINDQSIQKKLGWQVTFENLKEKKHFFYIISAKDKKGLPLTNAKVSINFFRPTRKGFDQSLYLNETGGGVYKAETVLPLPGLWDVNIEIKKDTDKWKKKQRIKIAP